MERLLKHKKMVAVIAIIAAVLVSMAMILPSYAGVAEDMISAASSNGNAAKGTSGGKSFTGSESGNDYSSWSMSKTKAFEVPKEFSVRLHSYYDADNYAPTKLSASGNLTSKQVCMKDRSDRTLSMDPDDGPIFKLSSK